VPPFAALRPRSKRPRGRAAESQDELAPSIKKMSSHWTTAKSMSSTKKPKWARRLPLFHPPGSAAKAGA
jgi:hypothetical protein